jgi:hypothetical protein
MKNGICGCEYPKLAAAVSQMGGKDEKYLRMFRITGIFAILSGQESN